MTFGRLLGRNLFYHWRGNLAVLLGVVVGTSVLTGALLVGDSLRGSLRGLTLDQLGWVDQALVAGRFFREDLAEHLPAERSAPVLLLQGAASVESGKDVRRAGKVTILGIDGRFSQPKSSLDAKDGEITINTALAKALSVNKGDRISVHLQKSDQIPRETLLGKRKAEDVVEELTVTIGEVLAEEGMARFSLKPSPEPARNAFFSLKFLQDKLELPGRVNAILIGGARPSLQEELRRHLTLADWGIRLRAPQDRARDFFRYLDPRGQGSLSPIKWKQRVPEALAEQARANGGRLTVEPVIEYYRRHRNYLSLESQQMFLEPAVVRAAHETVEKIHQQGEHVVKEQRILVYLADSITDGKKEMPYAVVAAVDKGLVPSDLGANEIVLAAWPQSPLQSKPGDWVTVEYYHPDARGQLHKLSQEFKVRDFVPLEGRADDPDYTPEFPGITDKLDMAGWDNPPFPFSSKRIKTADDDFWKRYRTTPRAYVSLATGQKLWGNRFGQLTSLRFVPAIPRDDMEKALLAELKPETGGFVFNDVKEKNLQSASGSSDFGVLFLAFSFFLIMAALLLVGLLFRLNLDRRAAEIGLLLATGFPQRTSRRLLLSEGSMLAAVGSLVGLGGALVYAHLMLAYLGASWPGGQNLSFLHLHVGATSLVLGYVAALVVSLLTILWALRIIGTVTPRGLLAGETATAETAARSARKQLWSLILIAVCLLAAAGCLLIGSYASDHEAKAGSFFGSGALLLTACLVTVWRWMRGSQQGRAGHVSHGLGALGVRNAGRHPVRSLLTVGLLASASFVVVAVETFHKDTGRDFAEKNGGSGGFPFLAESDVPIFQDLNQSKTRAEFDISAQAMEGVNVFAFRVRAGDDASCLNLYQPLQPRLLGVPHSLIERGGFRFKATLADSQAEMHNPWLLLEKETDDAIPVFADANSAQWILKVGLGDTLEVDDHKGDKKKLRVVGLLQESIFQSELLLGEGAFLRLYPRQEGFQFFLIESPPGQSPDIKSTLETALANHGFFVTPTARRLKAFLAVENTYLVTFQALGGLGLLLGALGLAIVLLRSVWERRGELALFRALGFRQRALGWLVLAENGFLLAIGLAVGTLTALVAVAPHLWESGGEVCWMCLLILLAAVLATGLGAAALAVAATLRAPLLVALRRE
jgi:ABC-type antimicrobial peptide transport system permease subunit